MAHVIVFCLRGLCPAARTRQGMQVAFTAAQVDDKTYLNAAPAISN
ncbi:hypothetical protein QNO08_07385 [Arthrobacter sp. zg-Y820]|nr:MULTISPECIES: hypothetical protein [unclassified Arthrobacter]MCC9197659.1 hypothetical protein [Arthrobacter sp. zg-Y820]MDK1280526.1 hypothetical protein [Arthrobacter sp. zg.Y820]WIB10835.1 hypothetical protein QNO08_07385 [Arthrobacter sp. zg-Y820]